MKTLLACLLLVAVAQATQWNKLIPMRRALPPVVPTKHVHNPHIIGGTLASDGQFPYQVAVTMDNSYFCGGSIIAADTVLSAAHCVQGFAVWDMVAGVETRSDNNEPGRQAATSRNGIPHADYGPVFIVNDIAVIKLSTPWALDSRVAVVNLPRRSQVGDLFVGEQARVSGWGKISDGIGGAVDDMRFVDLPVITNAECESYYGSSSVRDTVICCGTNGGTVSTCNGDSGGPLVLYEGSAPYEIGIVSFGSSAGCESGAPCAFTRTTQYLDWIEQIGGVPIRP